MCALTMFTLHYGAVADKNKQYTSRDGEMVRHSSDVLDKDLETKTGEKMDHHHEEMQILLGRLIFDKVGFWN